AADYTTTITRNAGGSGYVPVTADFDGDGAADFAAYNTTTGMWFVLESRTGYASSLSISWGGTGYTPVKGTTTATAAPTWRFIKARPATGRSSCRAAPIRR